MRISCHRERVIERGDLSLDCRVPLSGIAMTKGQNMKIGIDVSQIVYGTGVSVYTWRLVENLLKTDKENEYVLFGGSFRQISNLKSQISRLRGNFESKLYPIPPAVADFVWNRTHILSIDKLIGRVDIFHSSDWTQPPSESLKVTTVHDLMALKFPELVHPKIVRVQKRRLEKVKTEVDRIIVPSEHTKKDLEELGFIKNKIKVIHEANNISISSNAEVDKVKSKYGLKGKYFLAFATGAYKNVKNVVKACEKHLNDFTQLVLIGNNPIGNRFEQKNLIHTGYISDKDYAGLMTGAKLLIFPSLYEGFGIPILDAFACETPVVTSNISSMPEVAGNAAVLVDPNKVGDIEKGINLALEKREYWINLGLMQLKNFSWRKTATETLELYKELYLKGR